MLFHNHDPRPYTFAGGDRHEQLSLRRLRIVLHGARNHDMDHLLATWGALDPHPFSLHTNGVDIHTSAGHFLQTAY